MNKNLIQEEIKNRAWELAEEHWQYVRAVLEHDFRENEESKAIIEVIGFHYKTAFVHGYKHGVEDQTFIVGAPVVRTAR